MPPHSHSKNDVASLAYVAGIHVFGLLGSLFPGAARREAVRRRPGIVASVGRRE
jgi:hypothetical protein